MFPRQPFNINSFFPDRGALAAPPRGKTLQVLAIFHTSVWQLAVVAPCAGARAGLGGPCGLLVPGSWAGAPEAPPRTFNLSLLWLHRNGTGFLPTPSAQGVLVAQGLGVLWCPVAPEGCEAWKNLGSPSATLVAGGL